jgi:hypothetical protein
MHGICLQVYLLNIFNQETMPEFAGTFPDNFLATAYSTMNLQTFQKKVLSNQKLMKKDSKADVSQNQGRILFWESVSTDSREGLWNGSIVDNHTGNC